MAVECRSVESHLAHAMCDGHEPVNVFFFFFQAEDGIRDLTVTGVQTCALPNASQNVVPVAATRNTCTCQSTIQDRPPQTQPQTVWRIKLHCSVWAVPRGLCMSFVPSEGNGELAASDRKSVV